MLPRFVGVLLLIPSLCHAEEGFHPNKAGLPPAVQTAWESTFFVEPQDRQGDFGTAFIVGRATSAPGKLELTLLTANHVVESICGEHLGFCPNLAIGEGGYDSATGADIALAGSSARVQGGEVVRRLGYPDLALIRLAVDDSSEWRRPSIPVAKACDLQAREPVYLIGYPWLRYRKAWQKGPIADLSSVVRRWSRGYFTGYLDVWSDWRPFIYAGSTADTLEGDSGGPVMDEEGEVVGVLDSGRRDRAGAFSYLGNDVTLAPQSFFDPCGFLADFIAFRPLTYVPPG